MEKTFQVVLCPDCFGDGIETCHNPDHGFLSGVVGAVYRGNESACPGCGHSSDHKMKGKCYTCKGSGKISNEYCNIIEERIKKAWEEKRKEKDLQAQSLFGTDW